MYNLFRLLFQSAFWRMLLRKGTWAEARSSLKRAHKDRRARAHLFRLAFLALVPALCIAYLAWLIGSGAIYFVPFVLPVIWLIQRNHKKQDETSLRIAPGPDSQIRKLTEEERAEVRTFLAQQALVLAVFLDRAASEAFLKQNPVPEGQEVISRRRHLELLRSIGAWERLAENDRHAMIDDNGTWEWERINRVMPILEPLRLLRWILRVDFYLPLIGEQLQLDAKIAGELVLEPAKVSKDKTVATISMIENGRNAARQFVLRCTAELISRGSEQAKDEEIRAWATQTSARLSGDHNTDLLLDNKLVSEAAEERVRWARALASTRVNFLDWTIQLLEGNVKPGPVFPAILGGAAANDAQ